MKKLSCFLVATFSLAAFSVAGHAASGDLDGSFNATGTLIHNGFPNNAPAYDLVTQPDGKMVIVTSNSPVASNGANPGMIVIRFNPDGTPDSTFGSLGNGRVALSGGGALNAIALQPDGKIVVAGRDRSNAGDANFLLARFDANGSLDSTFGSNGRTTLSASVGDNLTSLLIQPDGGIVATGGIATTVNWADNVTAALVRVNADGSIDTGFGSNGIATHPLGISSRWSDAALSLDGQFLYVIGGRSDTSTTWTPVIARYNLDGTLDTTYGGTGYALLELATNGSHYNSTGNAIAIQPDGKVLVGGKAWDGYSVFRLNAGAPTYDSTFSDDGRQVVAASPYDGGDGYFGVDLALQDNGRIVLSGASNFDAASGGVNSTLVRLQPDGKTDLTFDGDGRAAIAIAADNQQDGYYATSLRSDGAIVSAGRADVVVNDVVKQRIALTRYEGDRSGNPETYCGPDGVLDLGNNSGSSQRGRDVLVLPDNRFIMIYSDGFNAARYFANGTLDTTFGTNGRSTNSGQRVMAAARDGAGRIVLAGYTGGLNGLGDNDFYVARVDAEGDIDSVGFGATADPLSGLPATPGYVRISFGAAGDYAFGVLAHADGRIVAVGTAEVAGVRRFALVRLLANGKRDSSFGNDGLVVTEAAGHISEAKGVALQADGKYVVAGYSNPNYGELVVARYNTDGSLDASFGGTGIVKRQFVFRTLGHSVLVQPDGKILVGGHIGKHATSAFAVLRFNSDGTADETFGNHPVEPGLTTIVEGEFDASTSNKVSLALQPNGKIVVGGNSRVVVPATDYQMVLMRLNANGVPDVTFQGDGTVVRNVSAGTWSDFIGAVAVRPDNVIVAAAMRYAAVTTTDAIAMCFQP